jgi:hypothetical protein
MLGEVGAAPRVGEPLGELGGEIVVNLVEAHGWKI